MGIVLLWFPQILRRIPEEGQRIIFLKCKGNVIKEEGQRIGLPEIGLL